MCLRDGGVYRCSRYVGGATASGQLAMLASPLELGNDLYDVGWMEIRIVMGIIVDL